MSLNLKTKEFQTPSNRGDLLLMINEMKEALVLMVSDPF